MRLLLEFLQTFDQLVDRLCSRNAERSDRMLVVIDRGAEPFRELVHSQSMRRQTAQWLASPLGLALSPLSNWKWNQRIDALEWL